MSTTFRAVEESLVARIAAMDSSAYTLGRRARAKWHESRTPLTVISDPSSLGHLAFNVWIQNAPNDEEARGMVWDAGSVDNDVRISARVRVAFAFKLRAASQTKDARIATDAAADVVRAVMAEWDADTAAEFGVVNMRLVDGLQTSLSLDAHWLLISQDYLAAFDLNLRP
jgi:hypothetical protein